MNISRHKNAVRRYVSTKPFLYLPLARFRGKASNVVHGKTAIVIDGFPRTANTFCEMGFRVAQSSELDIAHHCHASAQILYAEKHDIPVFTVLRDPLGACLSLTKYRSNFYDLEESLKDYLSFFSAIKSIAKNIGIFRFEDATSDLGGCIRAVNEFYATEFGVFDGTAQSRTELESLMVSLSIQRGRKGRPGIHYIGRDDTTSPPEKATAVQAIQDILITPDNQKLLDRCEAVYHSINQQVKEPI